MDDAKNDPLPPITIRPFRASDSAQVRELFATSILSAKGSPAREALKAQLTTPISFICYFIFIQGLLMSFWDLSLSPSPNRGRVIGSFMSMIGFSTFCYILHSRYAAFQEFIDRALDRAMNLKGDLADIQHHYGMVKCGDLLMPGYKSGFWVAEIDENGKSDILGCIGLRLDVHASRSKDQKEFESESAELRRLAVSVTHRRRGIARQLINTAVSHARASGIEYLSLQTSSYNFGALRLYERLGWVFRKRGFWLGGILADEMVLDLRDYANE